MKYSYLCLVPLVILGVVCNSDTSLAQTVILNQQIQPNEITVRKGPDKRVSPDAEQLAYAERLYTADKFESVDEVTTQLLKDNSPLSSEAQYLRGKAFFALGKVDMTRQAYEWIIMRHPDSKVMRDGRLAKTLSKAATYLLDKRQWRDAGRFMNLLQQIDEGEVGRLGASIEKQLDRELSEFIARTEGRRFSATTEVLRDLTSPGYNNCTYLTCYVEDDKKCQASFDDTIAANIRSLERGREKEWQPKLEKWFAQRVKEFANQLALDAQSLPLLSQLATESEFASAMVPMRPPVLSAPYITRIENTSGNRHRYKHDFNNSQYEGKKACVETDTGRSTEIGNQLTLRFGRLDRGTLLDRLGSLIGLERPKPRPAGPKL